MCAEFMYMQSSLAYFCPFFASICRSYPRMWVIVEILNLYNFKFFFLMPNAAEMLYWLCVTASKTRGAEICGQDGDG